MAMVAYSCTSVSNMWVEWVQLRLDVDRLDDSKSILPLSHTAALGIDFTTMVDVGDSDQNRRALYELNRSCSSDWRTAFGRVAPTSSGLQNVAFDPLRTFAASTLNVPIWRMAAACEKTAWFVSGRGFMGRLH